MTIGPVATTRRRKGDRGFVGARGTAWRRRRWILHAARVAWIVLACAVSVKAVGWPTDHSVYPCFEAGGWAWWQG